MIEPEMPVASEPQKERMVDGSGLQDRAEVNYRASEDPQESCGSCMAFTAPKTCSIVKGPVDARMVCDEFAKPGEEDGAV